MKVVMDFLAGNHDAIGAIVGVVALFVSAYSIILSVQNMKDGRIHDRKSVMPIGHIGVGDYEDRLIVRVHNNGIGPMLIDRLIVTKRGSSDESNSALIDFMPDLPNGMLWTNFVGNIDGSALAVDKDITLLSLEGSPNDPRFVKARQAVRQALSGLDIVVTYRNVYGEQMLPVTRNLGWFARNFDVDGKVRRKS
jgi:hypothetical protein